MQMNHIKNVSNQLPIGGFMTVQTDCTIWFRKRRLDMSVHCLTLNEPRGSQKKEIGDIFPLKSIKSGWKTYNEWRSTPLDHFIATIYSFFSPQINRSVINKWRIVKWARQLNCQSSGEGEFSRYRYNFYQMFILNISFSVKVFPQVLQTYTVCRIKKCTLRKKSDKIYKKFW